jgi:hypothetical protein
MNPNNMRLEDNNIVIQIPVTFSRKFGRRWMIVPPTEGAPIVRKPKHDDTLLKALTRAHRWERWIETGRVKNTEALAEDQKINSSYVSRILRLNLLAPDIKTMILDGTQPRTIKLSELMAPFPNDWEAQRRYFGLAG